MKRSLKYPGKFPILGIGIALIGLFISSVGMANTLVDDAIVQFGWCAVDDGACLLKIYGYAILLILCLSTVIPLLILFFNKLKSLFTDSEGIKSINFYPRIIKKGNFIYLKIRCPREALFFVETTYRICFYKISREEIRKATQNTAKYYIELPKNKIYPSLSYDYPILKIKKNRYGELPVLLFDPQKQSFSLFQKNNEKLGKSIIEENVSLEDVVFPFGKYDLEMKVEGTDFLKREYEQYFAYQLNCDDDISSK